MKRFFASIIIGVSQAYTKLFPNTLKKRTWWPVFVVGIVLIAVVAVTPAHAFLEDLGVWLSRAIAGLLLELAKLCIFLAIFFLRYFITLASYNNYIDVSVVKLGWVMVRDVANMFFIVGLLVIAFATILGLESYEWKKGVVKIILMAILINFSNLIAQLVIDVAHIFTITFLNAVAATAGGNLITLFQFDKILALSQRGTEAFGGTIETAGFSIFAASVLAFIFALLAALTIGAYLLVMMARIVVLWALIILSPLAFMMYALPKGEEYAHEWWKEFSKHVIVAPIMVFFLWLAFATFGTGQIMSEIQSDPNVININSSGEEQSVSILDISTWENLASFLLGIAFLWVGIKKTEETGATGAGLVGKAVDFTKNVATIATGYAAGRWLVGGALEKGKEGIKFGAKAIGNRIPYVGGNAMREYGHAIKATYQKKGLLGVVTGGKKSGLGGYQSMMERSDRAKKLEEKGGIGNWLAARWIEPAGRAAKRAKDWEEGAERMHEAMEHSYSTSGSMAGQAKIEATLKLQDIEHRAEEKKKAKLAERTLENKEAIDTLEKMAKEKIHEENPEFKKEMEALKLEEKRITDEETTLKKKSEAEWRELNPKAGEDLDEDEIRSRDRYFEGKFRKAAENEVAFKKLDGDKMKYGKQEKHVAHTEHELIEKKYIPQLMADPKVMGEVREKVIDTMTKGMEGDAKKKEKAKLNRLMDRDGGIEKRIRDGQVSHSIHRQTAEEKASTEEATKPVRRATEKAEAEARDEILAARGLPMRYVAAVNTKHRKEDEEERSGLNFRELTEQAGELANAVKKLRDATAKGAKIDPEALNALGATLVVAMKRGNEYGSMAISKALETIGFQEKINADDMLGQQRKLLSAILGREITQKDVDDSDGGLNGILQRDFIDIVGEDEAQAFLKELDTGIKAMVKEGGVNMTGLIDDSKRKNGRSVFRMRDETQSTEFKGGRNYWGQEVDLPKLLGLGDIINRDAKDKLTVSVVKTDGSYEKDDKGNQIIDLQAIKQITTVLASLKPNTRLHNRAIQDIQELRTNDPKGYKAVIEALKSSDAQIAFKIASGESHKDDTKGDKKPPEPDEDDSGAAPA